MLRRFSIKLFDFASMQVIPNRSLDHYSAVRYGEDNFLSSFIFLLASCFLLGLAVARYAFELTANNLLNNLMKSVQDLMTDWGLYVQRPRLEKTFFVGNVK